MNQAQEQAAKARSYQLWQESGYVHGRDREHWRQAEQEVQALEIGRRESSVAIPCTPTAMVFAVASGWIELSSAIAGMIMWPAWRVQAG